MCNNIFSTNKSIYWALTSFFNSLHYKPTENIIIIYTYIYHQTPLFPYKVPEKQVKPSASSYSLQKQAGVFPKNQVNFSEAASSILLLQTGAPQPSKCKYHFEKYINPSYKSACNSRLFCEQGDFDPSKKSKP